MPSTTGQEQQGTLELQQKKRGSGPVECLGLTFENEQARREHFMALLKEKLQDPEFRKIPGFPQGSDEAILRMSDPPYYTACPNPFLEEFVGCHSQTYAPDEGYEREPFTVDVSIGKTDQLFQLHSYHTKVPYLAIAPTILHYTRPGDVVLDGFCGSGMTGLACQWCGIAPEEYRLTLEKEWQHEGKPKPEWGNRYAILSDLGPAASFIAAGFNMSFDSSEFLEEITRILGELEIEIGWMYDVVHTDGHSIGKLNYLVWSEVFSCPECGGEVSLIGEEEGSGLSPRSDFNCDHCGAELTRNRIERRYETAYDPATGGLHKGPKRSPVLVNYSLRGSTYQRKVEQSDIDILDKISALPVPSCVPVNPLPYMHMTHERARLDSAGVTHMHHFFLPRALHAVGALWDKASFVGDPHIRRMAIFWAEQAIWTMAILNRYQPQGFKQVNKFLNGVYYVPSIHCEVSPHYALAARGKRIAKATGKLRNRVDSAIVGTGNCINIPLASETIDYIFTDPPFGENIYYSDLNYLVESWHGVVTSPGREAIVDRAKKKTAGIYQQIMRECFQEYHRLLRPGRWMTVVFSNSSNAISRDPGGHGIRWFCHC